MRKPSSKIKANQSNGFAALKQIPTKSSKAPLEVVPLLRLEAIEKLA